MELRINRVRINRTQPVVVKKCFNILGSRCQDSVKTLKTFFFVIYYPEKEHVDNKSGLVKTAYNLFTIERSPYCRIIGLDYLIYINFNGPYITQETNKAKQFEVNKRRMALLAFVVICLVFSSKWHLLFHGLL